MPTNDARIHRRVHAVHIIGGGVMGLVTAVTVLTLARQLGLTVLVYVYERGAFGGGPAPDVAATRCQCWLHAEGVIYALTQPAVSLALQRSVRRLNKIAPYAFRRPPAFAVELAGMSPPASECFRVLGIAHEPVSASLLGRWFPGLKLPEGCRVYRTNDGVIDLTLLGQGLARHARRRGAELRRVGVRSLRVEGGRVTGLITDDGTRVGVGAGDAVVLACGARSRRLLGEAGVTVPGLRLFRSHLVATPAFGLPALLAVLGGGVNCVPHETPSGLINVFGDRHRWEIPAEEDGGPILTEPEAVEQLCREVEGVFGLAIPAGPLAWSAVKTEIVPQGTHSQAHHAIRVRGLANAWLALPGKLSQAAACAEELAGKLLKGWLGEQIAQPLWEREEVRLQRAA